MIAQDITERLRIQESMRRQREELAHVQRSAAMGELTATLSHEMNQPLTAISTNASTALRLTELDSLDLDKLRKLLAAIVEDDHRASEIIRHVRGMLKKTAVETERLDINRVVGDVASLLHSDALIKDIALELDLADDTLAVAGNRAQLQQVFLNLFTNGFDAMMWMRDGERKLTVKTTADAAGVHVSVGDQGTGFTETDIEDCFAPFRTTKSDGMGMGLAISRTIVEAHGGKIWAENNPDRGATVHFTLPVVDT